VSERAVLVPTAEREPALGLALFQPIFRGVRAIMYNSLEERATIQAVAHNESVPGLVVGVGSAIPESVDPVKAREKFGLKGPFLVYVGRIDENKGCAELFDFFLRYLQTAAQPLDLVLIGTAAMPIPDHPRIRHLGYVADQDKFNVIAAASALVMPSFYESLSMVALEAWALGRPVLANARCDVLLGQSRRSGAGLCYGHFGDFETMVGRLLDDPSTAADLGRRGREYYDAQYSWSVIEDKYLSMFDRLRSAPRMNVMEPLPGWFARRRPNLAPAIDVVAALPAGAAVGATA
jgi:glycosyltransferase involved in cell wall biosynthesis